MTMTKTQLRVLVGENVKTARLARKLTRELFSELIDTSVGHVGLIERGERGTNSLILYKVATTLNVSIDSLFKTHSL